LKETEGGRTSAIFYLERRAERPWELAALIPPLLPSHLYLRRLDEAPTIAAGLSRFRRFLSSHYAL
jgi:hypothetical protein